MAHFSTAVSDKFSHNVTTKMNPDDEVCLFPLTIPYIVAETIVAVLAVFENSLALLIYLKNQLISFI